MSLPGPEDVLAAARAAWAADTVRAALVPAARVAAGEAPENTAYPYLVLAATGTKVEHTTGPLTLLTFRVEASFYGVMPFDPRAVRGLLLAAFSGPADAPAGGITLPAPARAVDCAAAAGPPAAGKAGWRVQGQDVVKVTQGFDWLVQGEH